MRQFLAALLLLVPSVGWGQNTNTMPPMCTANSLLSTCVPQVQGTIARINDATDATVCTNSGSGTTTVTCQFDGSSWFPIPAGGTYLGESADTITNPSSGTFMFTNDAGHNVIITCADQSADCNMALTNGGAGTIAIGTGDNATSRVDLLTNLVLLTTAGALDATIRGADLSGAANTRLDTTGAGQVILGSDDVTAIVAETDVSIDPVETATFGAPDLLFTTGPSVLNQYIGIPKLNVTHLGATLATGDTLAEGINPLVGTCAPITDGDEAEGTLRITGTKSYQYTGDAAAVEDDGFDCDVTGPTVGDGTDSIGFWFRSDTVLTAATLDVSLLDGAAVEANANMPAITVVDEWQWIEIDFAADCNATCTGIDGFFIQVTAAGEITTEMNGAVIHIDSGAIWLDTAEEAIGDVQVGGVISVTVAAHAAGSANTTSELVEYTDYIVNYQTGADALVMLTDQSAVYGWTLEALN